MLCRPKGIPKSAVEKHNSAFPGHGACTRIGKRKSSTLHSSHLPTNCDEKNHYFRIRKSLVFPDHTCWTVSFCIAHPCTVQASNPVCPAWYACQLLHSLQSSSLFGSSVPVCVSIQWYNDKRAPFFTQVVPMSLCASAVAGTQFRIYCKLFILYCSIRHHLVWLGLICCTDRALEKKTNTQLLNRKVAGREIVRAHWALLLRNICAVLWYCADNQKEITLPEWLERIYKIFLYLSDSRHHISTIDISLGISLPDHNIKVKNRSGKKKKKKPLLKWNLFWGLRESHWKIPDHSAKPMNCK